MDNNYSHETAPNLAASSQKTARIVSLHSTRRVFRRQPPGNGSRYLL